MLLSGEPMKHNIPLQNISNGLFKVDIPELGIPIRGKVRDNWVVENDHSRIRVMVTTDRQAVHARIVCTVQGKGQIANLISSYWFEKTKKIVQNNLISVPHPNVLIAKQARTIPVEVVLRKYMAKSTTSTSVYHNYMNKGRRRIYGITFPEGLRANHAFPTGVIITPTTKALNGYDKELTDLQAKEITDRVEGEGTWEKIKEASYRLFESAEKHCLKNGIILADTKIEFGVDDTGNLLLIDELFTPECSRLWLSETYQKKIDRGENPHPNKDILVDWLEKNGFSQKSTIPIIDRPVINSLLEAYMIPYQKITGKNKLIPANSSESVRKEVLDELNRLVPKIII